MLNRRWLPLIVATLLCVLQVACTETGADDKKAEEKKVAAGDKVLVKDVKVVTTGSGLKYQDIKVGAGATAVKGKKVHVHYTGWLAKGGKKFDSSVDRNESFDFDLGAGDVIKGWDEGVAGMKVGGKRRLLIPSKLGYAKRGAGRAIPPDADLVFDVDLLKVE